MPMGFHLDLSTTIFYNGLSIRACAFVQQFLFISLLKLPTFTALFFLSATLLIQFGFGIYTSR